MIGVVDDFWAVIARGRIGIGRWPVGIDVPAIESSDYDVGRSTQKLREMSRKPLRQLGRS